MPMPDTAVHRPTQVFGGLVAVLGLIHNLATPMVHADVYSALPAGDALVADLFFVATGTTLILLGLLTVYSARYQGQQWAFIVTGSTGTYVTLLGIAAVALMPENPFAYVDLVLGVGQLIVLLFAQRAPRALRRRS